MKHVRVTKRGDRGFHQYGAESTLRVLADKGTPLESMMASDLLAARAEIAKLKAVVNAAAALVDQWEAQHNCPDCEAKAEAMGGRCDPTCDICLERWAVAHDAYDDARSSRERGEAMTSRERPAWPSRG